MKKHELRPTQVYLDTEMHRRLRRRAVDEDVTMSEIVRRAVDAYLGGDRDARRS